MKKRILGVVLCLVMVLSLLPAFDTAEAASSSDRVYLGGVELSPAKPYYYNGEAYATAPAGRTATFNASTSTLQLYDYQGGGIRFQSSYDTAFTVKMNGTNVINDFADGMLYDSRVGVGTNNGTITFSGSGTLDVNLNCNLENTSYIGFFAYNGLIFEDGSVNLTMNQSTGAYLRGLLSTNISVKNSANLGVDITLDPSFGGTFGAAGMTVPVAGGKINLSTTGTTSIKVKGCGTNGAESIYGIRQMGERFAVAACPVSVTYGTLNIQVSNAEYAYGIASGTDDTASTVSFRNAAVNIDVSAKEKAQGIRYEVNGGGTKPLGITNSRVRITVRGEGRPSGVYNNEGIYLAHEGIVINHSLVDVTALADYSRGFAINQNAAADSSITGASQVKLRGTGTTQLSLTGACSVDLSSGFVMAEPEGSETYSRLFAAGGFVFGGNTVAAVGTPGENGDKLVSLSSESLGGGEYRHPVIRPQRTVSSIAVSGVTAPVAGETYVDAATLTDAEVCSGGYFWQKRVGSDWNYITWQDGGRFVDGGTYCLRLTIKPGDNSIIIPKDFTATFDGGYATTEYAETEYGPYYYIYCYFPMTAAEGSSYSLPAMQTDVAIKPLDISKAFSGGVPPYTYSAVGLPAGLSIDSRTGIISGAPTAVGATSSATITATDAQGHTTSVTTPVGKVTKAGRLTVVNGGAAGYESGSAVPAGAEVWLMTDSGAAAAGTFFSGWMATVNGETLSAPAEQVTQFVMPDEDVTVTAVYTPLAFTKQPTGGTVDEGANYSVQWDCNREPTYCYLEYKDSSGNWAAYSSVGKSYNIPASVNTHTAGGTKFRLCAVFYDYSYELYSNEFTVQWGNVISGDVNGDGAVNDLDLTDLLRHVAKIQLLENDSHADVNKDGMVDAADVTALAILLEKN